MKTRFSGKELFRVRLRKILECERLLLTHLAVLRAKNLESSLDLRLMGFFNRSTPEAK